MGLGWGGVGRGRWINKTEARFQQGGAILFRSDHCRPYSRVAFNFVPTLLTWIVFTRRRKQTKEEDIKDKHKTCREAAIIKVGQIF
jgi:hypothetical protein